MAEVTEKDREAARELAREFHDHYERLAPVFGYETRHDTRTFDPESRNGRLMVAVCSNFIEREAAARAEGRAEGVAAERERCAALADNEPELPGPIPDEAWATRGDMERALRAAVRATKKCIAAAIRGAA